MHRQPQSLLGLLLAYIRTLNRKCTRYVRLDRPKPTHTYNNNNTNNNTNNKTHRSGLALLLPDTELSQRHCASHSSAYARSFTVSNKRIVNSLKRKLTLMKTYGHLLTN